MRWRLGWIGVGVWAMGCGSAHEGAPPAPTVDAPLAAPREVAPPAPLPLLASKESAREALAARYRLAPDRRALMAGADVDRWLGGDGTPVTATWNGVGWTLLQGAREVGRLPELPSYADLAGWLDGIVAARRGSPGSSATAPSVTAPSPASPLLSTREAFALARDAGARLATDKPAALGDGAHALAALALQLHDSFGMNAGLKARALGLVTLARAEGALARADEVLVAAALGYRGAAAQLAEALPDGDAVRAFARRDDRRLVQMTSPGARRLALRRYVERRSGREARSWVAINLGTEALELHVIGGRLEMASFDDRANVARAVPGLLTLHARREVSPAGSEAQQALSGRDIETALAALGSDERPWAALETAIAALSEVRARTAIARTLQTEKRLEEAWKAIEPTLGSYQGDALARGALIQQALGHEAEALALAQRNIERYPTSTDALGVLAELHWRARRHDEAAAALAARRLTPGEWRRALGQYAFSRRLDDALWSVVPLELADTDLNASIWLFRAAAALRAGPSDPHRAELSSHYRGDSPSHYHTLGRYLLGSTDEASALALGHDSKRSVEVAYYLGVKADIERRLPDAIGWYRVALEMNVLSVYETQLAFQRLGGWRQSGKSIARLAALPAGEDTPKF